jgi:hypothetical protein
VLDGERQRLGNGDRRHLVGMLAEVLTTRKPGMTIL